MVLSARAWAELWTEGGPEAAYYKKLIETYGQPALDLGCGSGRLLFPFLRAGLDVDGCDYSEDMVAVCQERAEKERSVTPALRARNARVGFAPAVQNNLCMWGDRSRR